MKNIYREEIIPGKLKVEIVYETKRVMAFHHTRPYWEQHIVIIPKAPIDSLSSCPEDPDLYADFFEAIRFVTNLMEMTYGGCRISSNVGDYQTTQHLHWYVHAGKRLRDKREDHE